MMIENNSNQSKKNIIGSNNDEIVTQFMLTIQKQTQTIKNCQKIKLLIF